MTSILQSIENIVASLPLPLLEVWGRLAFILGFALALAAFGGFTFRPGGRWGLGREHPAWDGKAFLSIPVTFLVILATGYLGSFIVLVPGAQTFESLKDLMVFLCVVLFGYPALLTVPFAYGLSDLIEGVPPAFLLDWLPGYFINPACFWVAYQLFGKDPDFRKPRTWGLYLVFVLSFMTLEPVLWGYICSDQFTSAISYRKISTALFFTTGLTWLLAPPAMLLAFPLARRARMFWAEIQGHVKERSWGTKDWVWESGGRARNAGPQGSRTGWPIRMAILTPFIVLILLMVGATAFVTLRSAERGANQLASRLHEEISRNIDLQLDEYLSHSNTKPGRDAGIVALLQELSVSHHGLALVLDRSGHTIASSTKEDDAVADQAVSELRRVAPEGPGTGKDIQFRFDHVTEQPLGRATWLAHAASYEDKKGGHRDWMVLTVMPESYYLSGIMAGNSRSAMVFAVSLLLALAVAAYLAALVTRGLKRLSRATYSLTRGDLSQRVEGSQLEEVDELSRSFNTMVDRLDQTIGQLREEVQRRRNRERALEESEIRLRASEGRVQLAVRAAKMGIWDWDVEKDQLVWDDAMYALYGVARKDFSGALQAWSKCLDPEDFQRANAEVQDALLGKREFNSEFRVKLKDGGVRVLRGVAQVIRAPSGRALRMVGVNWDVTERLEADRSLRETEAFMSMAQHAAQVGSWEWDITTDRFKWSEELARMHGTTLGEFDGELGTVLGFCHPKDRERFQKAMVEVLTVADDSGFECSIVRKDGQERDLLFLGRTQPDERGKPAKVVGIALDMTDRRRLEAQVQQSQKMEAVGHLAGGIAHDFNNMLTAILGFAKFLKTALGPSDPRTSDADQIISTSERATALTRQLLSFSRKQVLQPVLLDLNRCLDETRKMLKPLLGEAIRFELSLAPGPVRCLADPGQVQQAVLNLAVNARDAMPQGGKILVSTQTSDLGREELRSHPEAKPGKYAQVAVTDTGTGMTPDVLARIFEPFFTTKGPGQGTGLGLPVVYGIVQQSGGFIEVESRPRLGTTFRLFFPFAAGEGTLDGKDRTEPEVPRGTETILVVEDEESLRILAKRSLGSYGYKVLTADQGLEALRILHSQEETIHLMVTDVVMPKMSGPALAETVHKSTPDLPILFVSGHADDITARFGLPLKDAAFLVKPYTPQELARKVREVLDQNKKASP